MTYCEPEVTRIAEATAAIRLDQSLIKTVAGAELTDPHRMTVPAYSADDEE